MPRIDANISLGSIISVLASLGAIIGVYVAIRTDLADMRRSVIEHDRRLAVQEIARDRDDRETGQLREQLAGRLVSLEVAVRTLTNTVERLERTPTPPRGNL